MFVSLGRLGPVAVAGLFLFALLIGRADAQERTPSVRAQSAENMHRVYPNYNAYGRGPHYDSYNTARLGRNDVAVEPRAIGYDPYSVRTGYHIPPPVVAPSVAPVAPAPA